MPMHMRNRRWKGRSLLTVICLFLGALLVRGYALGWELPYVEHPDEPAVVETVVRMVRNGDLNPHSFLYPSLCLYLFAAATRLQAWWGLHHGLYRSLQDLPLKTYTFTTAPGLYVWNRAVTALLGAATVPLLYSLGRRMFDERVGLLGALLLLTANFHVAHSHYITTDAPTGPWVVLALIGTWQVATAGDWSSYGLAGVGLGLAAGTKYNAGVVAVAPVVAHGLYWRRRSTGRPLIRLVGCGALALGVFVATTPYALLDWRSFIAGLRFNAAHYASGSHGDFTGRWQIQKYAKDLWNEGLLATGSVIAAAGLPLLLRRFGRQTALLLIAIGAEMALLMSQSVNFVRNILPVYPLMILVPAAGAVALADLVRRQRARQAALAVLAGALLVPQAQATAWTLRYWSRPHTMAAAAEELRKFPRGMRAAVEMNPVAWAGDPVVFPVKQLIDHPSEWYRANGFRYLVTNSDHHSAADRDAYARLAAGALVVAQYPERRAGIQPGPGGTILDLGEHPEAMTFVRRAMRWGDMIELLGYELRPGAPRAQITPLGGADEHQIRPGEPVEINLYWRSLARMDRDYSLFVHVVDTHGGRVAQRDLPVRYDDYPTSHWQRGEMVIDRADLALPALPAGAYRIEIGLYDPANGAPLPYQALGGGSNPSPQLTTLTIR